MDDLAMVRELAHASEAPDVEVLRATRAAIVDAAREQRVPPSTAPSRRRPRRRTLAALASVAAAAAVTVAVLVAPAARVGNRPPVAQANAAEVLQQAATVARVAPDVVPRADQYVYVAVPGSKLWLSVDGAHDGLSVGPDGTRTPLAGCRGGVSMVAGNYQGVRPQPCTPMPAYQPTLPTGADAMYSYLTGRELSAGTTPDPAAVNRIGKLVDELFTTTYLTGAQRAALLEAVGRIPGLKLTQDAAGPAGVRGTAVSWDGPSAGDSAVLLFDPTTHALESFYTRAADGSVGGGVQSLPQIVDQPGEQP